tara:strand:+ start:396 stop:1148 length:753 start_codon:yes stop_codon:yes gene_type:complete
MTFKKEEIKGKQYKLTRGKAPLSYILSSMNSRKTPLTHFDEKLKVNRTLRYARNQKSPFEDMQDGAAIVEPIIFDDGFLNVPRENQILQEFLYYHPENGRTFMEVDNAKDAEEILDSLNLEADALSVARKLDIEQVITLTRVLFNTDPSKSSSGELRRDILVYAKKEPQSFLEAIDDPMLELQAHVSAFFDDRLLTFRNNKTEVFYNTPSNKTRMLVIPFEGNASTMVADFLQSDDGLEMYKMLQNLAKK